MLVLAALFWFATFLPPGTMASIALESMAAFMCAVGGMALVAVGATLRLRS